MDDTFSERILGLNKFIGLLTMNKNILDILVMTVAFITGLAISIGHNPLLGVGLLLLVLTAWNLAPKVPKMIKAKSRIQ